MGRKNLIDRGLIGQDDLCLAEWPVIDTNMLADAEKEKYERRKLAVEMYLLDKATIQEISIATKIEKSEIQRFVERCLSHDEFGDIQGFRALNPHFHVKNYTRDSLPNGRKTNYSGAFDLLLIMYPELRELIHNKVLKTDKKTLQPVYRVKDVHKSFIDKCKEIGIQQNQYPRNTQDRAKRSLERYIKNLKERHLGNAEVHGEIAAMIARTVGKGEKNHPINFRPFNRVQFDGHKIDMIVTIRYTEPDGSWVRKILKRMWLLVCLDVPSMTVLGYFLCLKSEKQLFPI